MRGVNLVALAIGMVLGCARQTDAPRRASSERERDSVLGASRLPGATGVRGALRLSDSAEARNARIDSAGAQP
jgi:hypothetical protein